MVVHASEKERLIVCLFWIETTTENLSPILPNYLSKNNLGLKGRFWNEYTIKRFKSQFQLKIGALSLPKSGITDE